MLKLFSEAVLTKEINYMDIGSVILNQILIMFILMLIGYVLYKKKWINDVGTKQMCTILMYVCTPCIIISAFEKEFKIEELKALLMVLLLSTITIVGSLIIGKIFLKKDNTLGCFSIGFSNAGFIGIPLVQNVLGIEAVFYLTAYLAVFNIISWSYGIYLITGDKKSITIKKCFINPAFIGTALGLIVFIFGIDIQSDFKVVINHICNINTPLAMIVLGTYVAKFKLSEIFTNKTTYIVSFLRLILAPIAVIQFLKYINIDLEIKLVLLIASSAPVGASVSIFAQQYGGDYEYGAKMVSLSTLLCLITIPCMLILGQWFW